MGGVRGCGASGPGAIEAVRLAAGWGGRARRAGRPGGDGIGQRGLGLPQEGSASDRPPDARQRSTRGFAAPRQRTWGARSRTARTRLCRAEHPARGLAAAVARLERTERRAAHTGSGSRRRRRRATLGPMHRTSGAPDHGCVGVRREVRRVRRCVGPTRACAGVRHQKAASHGLGRIPLKPLLDNWELVRGIPTHISVDFALKMQASATVVVAVA